MQRMQTEEALTVYSAGWPRFGARVGLGEAAVGVQVDLAVVLVLAEALAVAVAVAVQTLVQVTAAVVQVRTGPRRVELPEVHRHRSFGLLTNLRGATGGEGRRVTKRERC